MLSDFQSPKHHSTLSQRFDVPAPPENSAACSASPAKVQDPQCSKPLPVTQATANVGHPFTLEGKNQHNVLSLNCLDRIMFHIFEANVASFCIGIGVKLFSNKEWILTQHLRFAPCSKDRKLAVPTNLVMSTVVVGCHLVSLKSCSSERVELLDLEKRSEKIPGTWHQGASVP